MAKLVDQQNAREPNYIPMSTNPEQSPAFQAALKLVLEGKKAPNGYTEYTLHEFRKKIKGDITLMAKMWDVRKCEKNIANNYLNLNSGSRCSLAEARTEIAGMGRLVWPPFVWGFARFCSFLATRYYSIVYGFVWK